MYCHNNDRKRRKKPTNCTSYKNTAKVHVSVAAAIICTVPTYRPMPNHVPTRVRRGSSYHSGTVDCQWADA